MIVATAALGLLLLLASADRDETALDTLRDRAATAAKSGEEGLRSLVRQAASGAGRERRAALEALGALPEGTAPEGTIPAGLLSLSSADPELRAAATRALLACGEPARAALDALAATGGARAADALSAFRRRDVEREFLSVWTPDDGQYRGMYSSLLRHGAFGARVLTAIALDRRFAGQDLLGYGPYAWLQDPGPGRDRSECRERALTALEDAGTLESAKHLRSVLRRTGPAEQLLLDYDDDPIPPGLDDAVRRTLACLGDPEPLLLLVEVGERNALGSQVWSQTVELRRRASAHGTLGDCLPGLEGRAKHRDRCVDLQRDSIRRKFEVGIPVDGVEYYNLACALSRRNDPARRDHPRAIAELEKSVKTYAVSADWLARDGDLKSLHGDPRFEALVNELRAREKALDDAMKGR